MTSSRLSRSHLRLIMLLAAVSIPLQCHAADEVTLAFDGFDPGASRQGWILRLRVDKFGLVAWDTVPLQIDDEGTPHLDRATESPAGRRGDERLTMRPVRLETP